jgi:hypothetical protein
MPLSRATPLKRLAGSVDDDAHPAAGVDAPRMTVSAPRFVRRPSETRLSPFLAGLRCQLTIRSLKRFRIRGTMF